MKPIFQVFSIALVALFSSCNNGTVKDKTEDKAVDMANEIGLSLDNGSRWKANAETTEGVHNMIHFMESHSAKDDVKSYNSLSDSLQFEFQFIFKNCSMKGEAHNQLHSFLLPMKGKFKSLSSDNLEECKNGYEDMKKHLSLYAKYFE